LAHTAAPPSSAHWTSGGLQLAEHAPVTQNWPWGQALPHDPQLFGSLCVFAQPPSHLVCWLVQPGDASSPWEFPSSPWEFPSSPWELPSSPWEFEFWLPAPFAQEATMPSVATQMTTPTNRPHFAIDQPQLS
jgi:hypothetical protein